MRRQALLTKPDGLRILNRTSTRWPPVAVQGLRTTFLNWIEILDTRKHVAGYDHGAAGLDSARTDPVFVR